MKTSRSISHRQKSSVATTPRTTNILQDAGDHYDERREKQNQPPDSFDTIAHSGSHFLNEFFRQPTTCGLSVRL